MCFSVLFAAVVTADTTVKVARTKKQNNTTSAKVQGVSQIAGSIVSTNDYSSGTTMDLNFLMVLSNVDAEYGDSLAITFPAGITPNISLNDPIGPDTLDPGPDGPEAYNGVAGQVISWGNNDNNWGGIVPGEFYNFTINVTIDPTVAGQQTASFHISGDGFGASPGDLNGTITIDTAGTPGIPNDTICGAIPMSLNTVYSGNTAGADLTDPLDAAVGTAGFACSLPNNTLWYSFTPTTSGNYDINTVSPAAGLDAWVGVFSAATCSSQVTYLACTRGAAPGASATAMVALTSGTTYYFMMDGFSGSTGAYDISLSQNLTQFPVNDTICGATVMLVGVVYADDNTAAAAADPLDAAVAATSFGTCSAPNNTLWYTFTPTISDNYIIATTSPAGNGLDGWISVFGAASCTDSIYSIDTVCSRAAATGAAAADTFALSAGTNYYIMIDGFSGSVGPFTIAINPQPNSVRNISAIKAIEVYPNPSTGLININTLGASTDLIISNAVGQVVYNQARLASGKHIIDLSGMAKGIYSIKAINGDNVDIKKISIN